MSDEPSIYLSLKARKAAQRELNVIRRRALDQLAEMSRVATLEAALRTIRSAVPGYLKGEMSEHDFALLVLENVDSAKVNKALEGKK